MLKRSVNPKLPMQSDLRQIEPIVCVSAAPFHPQIASAYLNGLVSRLFQK
jgi:hypothetical protein